MCNSKFAIAICNQGCSKLFKIVCSKNIFKQYFHSYKKTYLAY